MASTTTVMTAWTPLGVMCVTVWAQHSVEAGRGRGPVVLRKMIKAVALSKLHRPGQVDQAFGTAAIAGRFAETGVLRILGPSGRPDRQQAGDPAQ